mmetsp:Transcript_15212/g.21849  ORF Transcript_15212/g.21849 Transcript_15212/m.21849 type:complete len:140 (-) Transcript_15212:390-809(-)
MLTGVKYALLGLGDSKYTTFFQNPTQLDKALQLAGATRVGSLGKADASGEGGDDQLKTIGRWIDNLWPVLIEVISSDPPSSDLLEKARSSSLEICSEVIPDFDPSPRNTTSIFQIAVPVLVAIVAAVYFMTIQSENENE